MDKCPLSPIGTYIFLPLWKLIKPFFKGFLRLEVIGQENIPKYPCIVAANHRSYLDPPVLNAVFPEPLFFLAKEDLFKPPLGWLIKHMRTLPVKRNINDILILEESLKLLQSGCKICIFPEGRRVEPGQFGRPKPGLGFLAIKSGFPVLPVYIHGTDKILPRGAIIPKPIAKVKVVIGKPKEFKGIEPTVKNFKKVSFEIMEEIHKLYHSLARK